MQLQATEEYGLRCLLQVARRAPNEAAPPVSIQVVAESEGLSPEYAAKLLRALRIGGLVRSVRGAQGGYRLSRPAEAISVWDALSVLGGELFPDGFCGGHAGQACAGGGPGRCVHAGDCAIRALWRRVAGVLQEMLQGVRLSDLGRGEAPMSEWLAAAPAARGGAGWRSSR